MWYRPKKLTCLFINGELNTQSFIWLPLFFKSFVLMSSPLCTVRPVFAHDHTVMPVQVHSYTYLAHSCTGQGLCIKWSSKSRARNKHLVDRETTGGGLQFHLCESNIWIIQTTSTLVIDLSFCDELHKFRCSISL